MSSRKTVSVYGNVLGEGRIMTRKGYYRNAYSYTRKDGRIINVRGHAVLPSYSKVPRVISYRYDLNGEPQDLKRAVALIMEEEKPPTERFLSVSAEEFLLSPEEFIDYEEEWADIDVES